MVTQIYNELNHCKESNNEPSTYYEHFIIENKEASKILLTNKRKVE